MKHIKPDTMKTKVHTLPFGGVPATRTNQANGCKMQANAFFKALAKDLGLSKERYDLQYNAWGDWGETTFHTDTVYIQANFDRPSSDKLGVLIRSCKSRKDYTGGHNQWLSVTDATYENILNFYRKVDVSYLRKGFDK